LYQKSEIFLCIEDGELSVQGRKLWEWQNFINNEVLQNQERTGNLGR
jgi:hypothetical protein